MSVSRRNFLKQSALSVVALGAVAAMQQARAATQDIDPDLHLLNRISYGARPDDLARLKRLGQEAYLAEQLNPERIKDDVADAKLARLPVLNMDRKTIYALENAEDRAYRSLVQGFLLRATHSNKQLLERMSEFWTDHFNVPLAFDNNPDVVLFHQKIRQHALGKFRDLLIETAKSPAMLVYLDNAYSTQENPNENYARELLELHSMGVDGGYGEADVKEVARAFTGWTVHNRSDSGFYFKEEDHDRGQKLILGYVLPAERGIEDGLQVLSMLAAHPSTAQFICSKLCQKFVSDLSPKSLIDELVRVWQATSGDIASVLKALFLSREFAASQGQKFRRPLDFFIAASRATGSEVIEWWRLQESLKTLGQPPYAWEPPNGYPEHATNWLSTNGLLARWNIAAELTHTARSDLDDSWGVITNLHERIPAVSTAGELVKEVSKQVFGAELNREALEPFIAYASDGAGENEPASSFLLGRKLAGVYSLMLASPEFQWR